MNALKSVANWAWNAFKFLFLISFLLAVGQSLGWVKEDNIVLFVFLSLLITGIILFLKSKRNKINNIHKSQELIRKRFFERERLIDAIDRHAPALNRNLYRAIRKNEYGSIIKDNRFDALREFFISINLDHEALPVEEAVAIVFEQLNAQTAAEQEAGFNPNRLPVDGYAFERWVAESLNGFGWEAAATPASGDQGIDVIATRDGIRLGIQCKLYSGSIGNKAVQEAHAGRDYHSLDKVAVLSNAQFTRSAKELAAFTGVILCSHHDIPHLFDIVKKT